MILSEEYLSIAFRLINFGTVIGGAWYGYTYYVRSAVQKQIEQDEKTLAMLAQQKDAFHQQEQVIEQEIKDQEDTITHLLRTLKAWQEGARAEREADKKICFAIEKKIDQKMAIQSKNMQEQMIAQHALPDALRELERSLSAHFNSEKRGRSYLEPLLDQMNKDR